MQLGFMVPQCVFSDGASKSLGEMIVASGMKRVLCISDAGLKKTGIVDEIVESLKRVGLEVTEFMDVVADPDVQVADAAGEVARKNKAECVVAIGGGSSLDTAKIAAALATNPGSVMEYFGMNTLKQPCLPMFAVPTTAGTGSEITACAVISEKKSGKKLFVMDPKLMARVAVLDPKLTVKLPASITAATGMDALSHAVESFTSIANNPLTEAIALKAIELVVGNLKRCVENGEDLEARSNMLLASSMAGICFGNGAVHLGHALAHPMGATWHIPHGVACAIALPEAIAHCGSAMPDRMEKLAVAMGVKIAMDDSAEIKTKKVCDAITALNKSLGIPSITECKASKDDFDKIVKLTMEETSCQLSGVPFDEAKCKEIYTRLFEA